MAAEPTHPDHSLAAAGGGNAPRRRIARLAGISFLTGFSGAIMPGPLLVAVIEQTAAQGLWAVWWLISGHALLELGLVALLILGLHAVIERPRVRGAIGVIGGAALVWMGWQMLRAVGGVSLPAATAAAQGGHAIAIGADHAVASASQVAIAAMPWYLLL